MIGEYKKRVKIIENLSQEDSCKFEEIEILGKENGQIKEIIAQLEREKENRKEVVKIDGRGNIEKRGKARTDLIHNDTENVF